MWRGRSVRRSPDTRSQGSASPLPFWCCCVGNLALLAALIWWRAPPRPKETLPAERLISAMTTGVRYVRYSREMDATLIRAIAFFPFASAYLALLPLVARSQGGDGAEVYGQLMAAIGLGSIVATLALDWLKTRLGANGQAALGAIGTVVSLFLLAAAHEPVVGARRQLHLRRRVDRRADDLFCLGAGGFAGMGARSGPGDFPHCLLRRADARQRSLGRSRDGSRACPSRSTAPAWATLIGMALTWAWKLQTSEARESDPLDALACA